MKVANLWGLIILHPHSGHYKPPKVRQLISETSLYTTAILCAAFVQRYFFESAISQRSGVPEFCSGGARSLINHFRCYHYCSSRIISAELHAAYFILIILLCWPYTCARSVQGKKQRDREGGGGGDVPGRMEEKLADGVATPFIFAVYAAISSRIQTSAAAVAGVYCGHPQGCIYIHKHNGAS